MAGRPDPRPLSTGKRPRKELKRSAPIKRTRTMTPAAMAAQKANAAKRVYTRSGKTIRCTNEECGREFYAPPGLVAKRKFCSRRCMGFVANKERTCSVCGKEFKIKPRGAPRKTCSQTCRNEAIRRSKTGGRNPNYRGANKTPTVAWRAARNDRCEVRGCDSKRLLRQHHVVYDQHVRKRGGDPWDPRDSFTACHNCHSRHHSGADYRMHVADLTDANLAFAVELLGAYAVDYFIRYYAGERSEIEDLLERFYS